MIKIIVKLGQIFRTIFIIKQKLRISEFTGIREDFNIFLTFTKYKKSNRDILIEHRLHKSIEK